LDQPQSNASTLNEMDQDILHWFRTKMDQLKFNLCSIYNESFPSIMLLKGECKRYYNEKTIPKKFLCKNEIDPSTVPKELQDLTEIEEMLIAQTSWSAIWDSRHIINFPQDVYEFTTRLPRHLSSIDVLIIQQNSADTTGFKDFTVRRNKVALALYWLKSNNHYYARITIDSENFNFY
ncbi:4810_t:CDS:2, partial [Gigaspora rosea]